MSKNVYSMRTCGKVLGITGQAVSYRARKIGLDTSRGLTAEQVKMLIQYKRRNYGNEDALKKELEEIR